MSIYHKNPEREEQQSPQTTTQAQQSGSFIVDNRPEAKAAARLKQMEKEYAAKNAPKRKVNKTGIPDRTKAIMEACWGVSLDEVRVHYQSEKPALLNAHAYTEGLNIYIAPGQEQHLNHELSHVLQQIKGQVRSERSLTNGTDTVAINESSSLENEAVTTGKKINKVSPAVQATNLKPIKTPQNEVVQRAKKSSHYGEFTDTKYDFNSDKSRLNFELEFKPNEDVEATKIGLSQVVRNKKGGNNKALNPNQETKMTDEGYRIDMSSSNPNPLYAVESKTADIGTKDPAKLEDYSVDTWFGQHAERGKTEEEWTQNAKLKDIPTINGGNNSSKEFETSAIVLEGTDKGEYYGSVQWGFTKDKTGKLSKIDFDLVSEGAPSKKFLEAANAWNNSKTLKSIKAKANNTAVYEIDFKTEKFTLEKGIKVSHLGNYTENNIQYNEIKVLEGAKKDRTGFVKVADFEDGGDGAPTVDLPLPKIKIPTEDQLRFSAKREVKSSTDSFLTTSTRMKIIEEEGDMVKVEIVQGDLTGKQGWVEKSKLKNE